VVGELQQEIQRMRMQVVGHYRSCLSPGASRARAQDRERAESALCWGGCAMLLSFCRRNMLDRSPLTLDEVVWGGRWRY